MVAGEAAGPLKSASPAFRAVHQHLGARVQAVFPDAEPVVVHGMAGWQVAVPDPAPADSWTGTMDREHLQIFPTERKAGTTVHIWDPKDPTLLKGHETVLKKAGFKVMVGCVQWNRKAPLALDALEDLLRAARAAW